MIDIITWSLLRKHNVDAIHIKDYVFVAIITAYAVDRLMETLKQIHTEDGDPSELQLKHWIKGVGLLLTLENIMSDLMNTAVKTFRSHYSMWVNATDLNP